MARNGPPQNPGNRPGSLAPKELKGKQAPAAAAPSRSLVLRTDPAHAPTTGRFASRWHRPRPKSPDVVTALEKALEPSDLAVAFAYDSDREKEHAAARAEQMRQQMSAILPPKAEASKDETIVDDAVTAAREDLDDNEIDDDATKT